MAATIYPPGYEMKMMAQELCKLWEPKIKKLKGGYSAITNLIFQSWLKDIKIHVEDWNLTQREAIQFVKDFITKQACDKVEFYMGMVVEDQKTFKGLINHLKSAFQLGETHKQIDNQFLWFGPEEKQNRGCICR